MVVQDHAVVWRDTVALAVTGHFIPSLSLSLSLSLCCSRSGQLHKLWTDGISIDNFCILFNQSVFHRWSPIRLHVITFGSCWSRNVYRPDALPVNQSRQWKDSAINHRIYRRLEVRPSTSHHEKLQALNEFIQPNSCESACRTTCHLPLTLITLHPLYLTPCVIKNINNNKCMYNNNNNNNKAFIIKVSIASCYKV